MLISGQMPALYIQLGMLIIQALALCGLAWYCVETKKMREAAQKQVKTSEELIRAAMGQVEGLSKPCLTLSSGLRDPAEVISGRVMGSTIAIGNDGNFVVQNIGNGPALNVRYTFVGINETAQAQREYRERYVQNVLAGQQVRMVEPKTTYNGDFEVVFHYESIGGGAYETKLTMIHYVMNAFKFGPAIPNLSSHSEHR